ncbi:MAG: hypothetical protein J5929_06725 [Eubacterium sp.]|nr:hypothetical protein [Eubacterium sp.]
MVIVVILLSIEMEGIRLHLERAIIELNGLPKGSIVYKTIKGKKQPYLQWREDGKTKSRYIKADEMEMIVYQIDQRKRLLKLYYDEIERLTQKPYGFLSSADDGYDVGYYDEQELISKKDEKNIYSVDRLIVNSKLYYDKFMRLPLSATVKDRIVKEAGRLLERVDGTNNEGMIALDKRTGDLIVDNLEREKYENHTSFSDEEYQKIIEANSDIIVIHNHPSGSRPSARDIITYAMADIVVLSVVVGHNGDVYAIFDAKKKVEEVYHSLLKEQKKRFYDNDMAVSFAINALYEMNSRLGKKQKLFDVRRL